MTTDIEPGDMENELRELFRDKAGEAPLSTPAAPGTAPPHVLRRGRRRQIGTVLGSVAAVVVLIAGSVAGLQRLLDEGPEPLPTAGYDVFERTATIEAFTVTSPSDWYLVNKWPLSLTVAVEGTSGSSSFECQGTPVGEDIEEIPECSEARGEARTELIPVHGLPMFQLTNADIGLSATTCRSELGGSIAVLYVAMDSGRAIDGTVDPSIPPFPPGDPGLPPESDGPCGPGRYSHFTVNGEPFFAWIGLGPAVSDEDREIVETAYERMSAIPDWTPTPPNDVRPGYVIAGGDGWRLELRGDGEVVELSLQDGPAPTMLSTDGSVDPLTWTGSEPIFGTVSKLASGVEFRPDDGEASIAGTIVPVPPSLDAFEFDLFFLEGVEGRDGDVVAVGLGPGTETSPSPLPEPIAAVRLSGGNAKHTWTVRFTGSFADDSACIVARLDSDALDAFCLSMPEGAQPGDAPALDGWLTETMYLLAGSVPLAVEDIRFVSDDGGPGITELQCTTGPIGWPDTKVCALTLPTEGSGTLRYLDAEGNVLFADGIGWGSEVAELPATPVVDLHGGTYWAVYPWVGAYGDPAADTMSERLAHLGIEAFPGDLSCDEGAAQGLGVDAAAGIGVYFDTRTEAETFANYLVDSNIVAVAPIAEVTTYCRD